MKCPKPELLLEWVSIPEEVGFWRRSHLKLHASLCTPCRDKVAAITRTWNRCLSPEPDITSSLLSVYSRLQKDETLILKGWKIGKVRPVPSLNQVMLKSGWLFRGSVGIGLAAAVAFVFYSQNKSSNFSDVRMARRTPLTQIRVEQKNGVRVHYLQPELLQTVEFETASGQ